MPVAWDELSEALKRKKIDHLYFAPKAALDRLEKTGDLFADVLKLKQSIPANLAEVIQEQNKREGREPSKQLREYSRKRTSPSPPNLLPRFRAGALRAAVDALLYKSTLRATFIMISDSRFTVL